MPYPNPQQAAKGTTIARNSADAHQRKGLEQNMADDGVQGMGYEPETPDPQGKRGPPSRAVAPDSGSSQA